MKLADQRCNQKQESMVVTATPCNTPCGQCRGDVCSNVTGYCPHGCKSHWTGLKCGCINIVEIIYTISNTVAMTYGCIQISFQFKVKLLFYA